MPVSDMALSRQGPSTRSRTMVKQMKALVLAGVAGTRLTPITHPHRSAGRPAPVASGAAPPTSPPLTSPPVPPAPHTAAGPPEPGAPRREFTRPDPPGDQPPTGSRPGAARASPTAPRTTSPAARPVPRPAPDPHHAPREGPSPTLAHDARPPRTHRRTRPATRTPQPRRRHRRPARTSHLGCGRRPPPRRPGGSCPPHPSDSGGTTRREPAHEVFTHPGPPARPVGRGASSRPAPRPADRASARGRWQRPGPVPAAHRRVVPLSHPFPVAARSPLRETP